MATGDYTACIIYLFLVVCVGFWFSRGQADTENYLLGGRRMPWWLIGISYVVSLLSTLTMVGVPGEAYSNGVTMALGSLMLPVFSVIAFHIFVRFYFVHKTFTPFEYLEKRFNSSIRATTAGFFWITRAIYLGLVLYASAMVFVGADNWPVPLTIAVVGGIGVFYTLIGGFNAVVWSDFIQFVVLTLGIGLILLYATSDTPGGIPGVIEHAFAQGRGAPELSEPAFYGLSLSKRVTLLTLAAAILNEQLFFNSSDQVALQRLLSTSSYKQARRSIYAFCFIVTPVLMVLWFMGLAIFTYYDSLPVEYRPKNGDTALFRFIATELPTPIPGLIISAMLAAIMSTLDSGINSLATVATKDFYVRYFKRDANERDQLRISRMVTVITGLLAIGIALGIHFSAESTVSSVLETSMAWMSLSVALPPVFLLGIFSLRATAPIAMATLVTGWVVTAGILIVYHQTSGPNGPAFSFLVVGLPGPIIALILGMLLSMTNKKISNERIKGLTWMMPDKSKP